MKHILYALLLILGVSSTQLFAQQQSFALVQLIHNCADPLADSVDVWISIDSVPPTQPAIDNFAFRSATTATPLPTGVPIEIGIAPKNSTMYNQTISRFTVTLDSAKGYVFVAGGVLDTSMFAPNPDGISIAFTAFSHDHGIFMGPTGFPTDPINFLVHHGSTDAPAVEVFARGEALPLVPTLAYGQFIGYIPVPTGSYMLDVKPAGSNQVAKTFNVTLPPDLAGSSAVLFASGFLNSSNNQNGASFTLCAAFSNGRVVVFAPTDVDTGNGGGGGGGGGDDTVRIGNARLQVVHNSADSALRFVDIYVNGQKYIDNIEYKTATEFRTVPSGTELIVSINQAGSRDANDSTLFVQSITLDSNQTYILIANGVLGSTYSNPRNRGIGFSLVPISGRERSTDSSKVQINFFHGSTDALDLDLYLNRSETPYIRMIRYGVATGYVSLDPAIYNFGASPADLNSIIGIYTLDASRMAGQAGLIIASGFAAPVNQNPAAPFSVYYVGPGGGRFVDLGTPTSVASYDIISFDNGGISPNPTQNSATLTCTVRTPGTVALSIVDAMGNVVMQTPEQFVHDGMFTQTINTSSFASGMYSARIMTNGTFNIVRFVVVR